MDRELIIRLAREAGMSVNPGRDWPLDISATDSSLERFAALVIANNPPQSWMTYQLGLETGKQAGAIEERKHICDMLLDMHAKEERHNYYGFIANIIKEST